MYGISQDGAIFSVGKHDDNVEIYSKIYGLNDNNVRYINYSNGNGVLVVAYSNSNIDLITDDNEIINIPDIYSSNSINADKSIKSISYKRIWVKLEYTRWFRVTDQIMEERPDGTTLYYAEEIPGRYTEKEVDRADATYIFRFEY